MRFQRRSESIPGDQELAHLILPDTVTRTIDWIPGAARPAVAATRRLKLTATRLTNAMRTRYRLPLLISTPIYSTIMQVLSQRSSMIFDGESMNTYSLNSKRALFGRVVILQIMDIHIPSK